MVVQERAIAAVLWVALRTSTTRKRVIPKGVHITVISAKRVLGALSRIVLTGVMGRVFVRSVMLEVSVV